MRSRKFLLLAAVGFISLVPAAGRADNAAATHSLQSGRQLGDVTRVEIQIEVGGHVKLTEEQKVRELPMSVVGRMSYHEKLLELGAERLRGVRHYDRADAVIKIEKGGVKPSLATERRLVAVESDRQRATLFCPNSQLTREELDLLHVQGNSLLLDELLPAEPVAVGGQWKHPEWLLAALLGIDAISQSDVRSVLVEIDDATARMELTGSVQGAIDGVATDIELTGRYKFDLASRRITWLAALIKENRSIGHVGPGLNVTAKLQMTIASGQEPAALADAALDGLQLELSPEVEYLSYHSRLGGYRFLHDRRWHVMFESSEMLAMRMVDRGELLAQCNGSSIAPLEPGKYADLASFQQDIKKSLGESFGQFVKASETTNPLGNRVLRVEAVGMASDLPIQWNYYLVTNAQGRQVVFAFTAESSLMELLGGADAAIVDSLEFVEQPVATAAEPTLAK